MESSERCRRTDGKRWRCSKDVIPNEKYCQTHMHRGCRRRSRKLVESETTPKEPPNLNLTLPTPPKPIINAAAKDPSKNQASNAVKNADGKVAAVRLKIITHEISPQSVLVGKGPRAGEEDIPDEARRCRRTDGKRWRCTKEVIGEGHKYCANHMYRGAKKHCCHYNNTPNPYALVKRDHKLPFAFDTNPSP